MQLTVRDRQVIRAVYEYGLLRRSQIQALFFSGQNTANRRLQNLFQHGFLKRHLPPVQLGEGRSQAIYSLDERGADLIAIEQGVDRAAVRWKRKDNQANFLFLNHTLSINDFRIAITLAAKQLGHRIMRWLDEREIKALGERVPVAEKRRGYLPVAPDAFFEYDFGDRQAGFFAEVDMGTMSNKRFKDKVRAYILYKTEGYYEEKFGISSLRVLTVAPSYRRLKNLKRTTEQAQGRSLFWFTTFAALSAEEILQPRWYVAGQEGTSKLFEK
jgi:DNA-binding HxlR family transcriptional regulator